jgi:hypothetical protein
MAAQVDGLTIAARVVKGLAIAAGAACTYVAFASLAGIVTGNGWARLVVGLLFTVGLPALAVDRMLPGKNTKEARPGLVVNVVALTLLAIAVLFVGLGQPVTRPLMVREGDRLAEDGHEVPAHVVYLMAGVRPVDAAEAAAAGGAAGSASGAASSSAGGAGSVGGAPSSSAPAPSGSASGAASAGGS